MKIVGTVLFLLVMASSAMAGITLIQSYELQLPASIEANGDIYLTDVDQDGYLDILYKTDTYIGWYSIVDERKRSEVRKKSEWTQSRSYVEGRFDGDSFLDYVEIYLTPMTSSQDLLAIYYLSSDGFTGQDTVVLAAGLTQHSLKVNEPSTRDRNQDGIDELYASCFYYEEQCYDWECNMLPVIALTVSHQFGQASVGSESAPKMYYNYFPLSSGSDSGGIRWYDSPLDGISDNPYVYLEGWWGYVNLNLEFFVDDTLAGTQYFGPESFCFDYFGGHIVKGHVTLRGSWHGELNSRGQDWQLLSIRDRYTYAYDIMVGYVCEREWSDILCLSLGLGTQLDILWQVELPDWATSNIIFADTSSPNQLFLSNGTRLYQVRSNSLEILDSSSVLDLAGHMIGFRPLTNGEAPTLLLIDGNRLKFFKFDIVTDVDGNPDGLPTDFALSQNYPNPFNPTTEIRYSLPTGTHVNLTVFNALGQIVNVLVNEFIPAGTHTVGWNATDKSGNPVASGVYLYRLKAGDITETKKMMLLK